MAFTEKEETFLRNLEKDRDTLTKGLSAAEIEIINAFRKADEIDQEAVRRTLGIPGVLRFRRGGNR